MADITISYKNDDIAEISQSGTVTLDTSGKYCEDDITIEYVKPAGGRDLTVEAALIDGSYSSNYENNLVTEVRSAGFMNETNITGFSLPNCLILKDSAFRYCSAVTSYYLPKVTNAGQGGSNYVFGSNTSLEVIALPSLSTVYTQQLPLAFQNDAALIKADLGTVGGITNQTFTGCSSLNTIILRNNVVAILGNTSVFNGTPFASGGTGGTIYIPEALYNHLGDESNLDYKSASNWSVLDGYGTVTWAKIEGSQYETKYADGTDIISGGD